MNVHSTQTPVTSMLTVPTLWDHTHVHVILDIVEMDCTALVNHLILLMFSLRYYFSTGKRFRIQAYSPHTTVCTTISGHATLELYQDSQLHFSKFNTYQAKDSINAVSKLF